MTSSYYRGAHGILLVFDLTAPATFNNLRAWHTDCLKFTSECSFVLVGNKSDEKAEVTEAEGTGHCYTRSVGGNQLITCNSSRALSGAQDQRLC